MREGGVVDLQIDFDIVLQLEMSVRAYSEAYLGK